MVFNKQFKRLFLLLPILMTACGTNQNNSNPKSTSTPSSELPEDTRELNAKEYAFANLCGEDALGRVIQRIDREKENKRFVGVFYSMWLGQHKDIQHGIYNVTTLESTPEGLAALNSLEDSPLSRMNEFHFWGEPLYGYYNTKDPWILTRHIELFMNAGVDYLCIDSTNRVIYVDAITTLLDLLLKYHKQGYKIPKIMFYTNSYSGTTVSDLYNKFYQTEKYNDVWFAPNGKPMIIGITKNNAGASDQTRYNDSYNDFISDDMCEFFDVKESEWPNGLHNDNSIPWMSWDYPQRIHNGSIAVPVAQHSHSRISVSWRDPECHRGYNNETGHVDADANSGQSFQQMWNLAHSEKANITNVLCTSFNEWMAIKSRVGDTYQLVDVFDYEYSRDMEMMKGGYGDNYYLQLVENIRRFKYEPFVKYKKEMFSIDIHDGISPIWDFVKAQYQELTEDAIKRNFEGAVSGLTYVDDSARNDINIVKVTHDEENVYFYIECLNEITERQLNDTKFMNLLLKSKDTKDNFIGFNYVINRSVSNGKASIEKCIGGYNFEKVGDADISINGKVLQLSIPRSIIETNEDCDLEFKVTDNITNPEDVMDYYISGDSMPLGRMRYGY